MRSILIVDDDQNTVNGLIEHVPWNEMGISNVTSAENGLVALDSIRLNQPDILITDIYMPKMDGLELIEKVHQSFPEIYIIIHSGYDDFENARRAMKFGVQYFFLKPCVVSEIKSVICDIITDMHVQETQQKLEKNYNIEMDNYLAESRESFFRQMLISKHRTMKASPEKLELYQIPQNGQVIVTSVSLIQFAYFTKAKEREWQLKRFGVNNIIKETIKGNYLNDSVDIQVVDYSDFTFILIFISNNHEDNLKSISIQVSKSIVDNLLLYLNVSLVIGVGNMKSTVNQIVDSYMESQKALEVAEYQEINKVYVYSDVEKENNDFIYPFEILKDINHMIHYKQYDLIMEKWDVLEKYLTEEHNPPLLVTQNICFNVINLFIASEKDAKSDQMGSFLARIYARQSSEDAIVWTRGMLEKWIREADIFYHGKDGNQIIRDVKKYVREYYDQRVMLADIADSLYINRNYLSQLFKKVTGESFVTFLNKYRIAKAKEKLAEKNYMVYEISEMVGYQNPTYFSQVFKSITGKSPTDYYN